MALTRRAPRRGIARLAPALVPVVAALAVLAAVINPGVAAAKSARWERYDVTIDLHDDGSFTVTEDQTIAFSGSFTQGYAVIPLSRVEDITNVRVFEDSRPYTPGYGQPGSYDVNIIGGEVEVLWWFTTAVDETRNFQIKYDVLGGLRVYPDTNREQLWWRAIDEDFAGDVDLATVTINLPRAVPQDQLSLAYYTRGDFDVTYQVMTPSSVQYVAHSIKRGDALEARLEFPRMTTASVPDWQAADDAKRAEEERLAPYKRLADALMLGVGLLLLVGGPIAVVMAWYTRGRDAPVALPIDLLREPPDDLPAAAVGTLIDEEANDHDVIAAMVSLGERNVLEIDEIDRPGVLGALGLSGHDFEFRRVDEEATLAKFEDELMEAIFGSRSKKDEVKLSKIRERFSTHQQEVKDALYDEVVKRGYFARSPQATRRIWRGFGVGLLVVAAIAGFVLYGPVSSFAPLTIVPIVATGIVALFVIAFAGAMPRKTPAGSEAAARWLAFRRYLAEIERYQNLAEAKEIFNRYLPYAVAFGLERSWVRKFASVDAPVPQWYGPYGWDRGWSPSRRRNRGVIVVPTGGGGGGRGVDLPDLQSASDALGGGLQGMSDGLFNLFNEASKAFTPISKSSGGRGRSGGFGGFSGGGGSFGGGGGGGGRGFR